MNEKSKKIIPCNKGKTVGQKKLFTSKRVGFKSVLSLKVSEIWIPHQLTREMEPDFLWAFPPSPLSGARSVKFTTERRIVFKEVMENPDRGINKLSAKFYKNENHTA